MICDECNEIGDRVCRIPECKFECMDKTHFETQCCHQTSSDNFCRKTSLSEFFASKHRRHIIDEFFGKSVQKAIIFSYNYYMDDAGSGSAFCAMIKRWMEIVEQNPRGDRYFDNLPPCMILFSLVDSYGPGLDVSDFLNSMVQLYTNSTKFFPCRYGYQNNMKSEIDKMMRLLGLAKVFDDLISMHNLQSDWHYCMERVSRPSPKTIALFSCKSIDELEKVRGQYFSLTTKKTNAAKNNNYNNYNYDSEDDEHCNDNYYRSGIHGSFSDSDDDYCY